MKDRKKYIVLIIVTVALMLLTIFLVGRSFGFFKYIKEGEVVNTITINGIEINIINAEADALNLENAYPMSDSEGLTLTPFEFTMTNTSSKTLNYSIIVENDEQKQNNCALSDSTICPVLTTDYIRYSYKKDDGTYSEPKTLADSDNVIASGIIEGNQTITSSIILWVSSEAGNEIMNHYFFGKLLVTGAQNS